MGEKLNQSQSYDKHLAGAVCPDLWIARVAGTGLSKAHYDNPFNRPPVQLVADAGSPELVNEQLEKMGFSIGTRLIEDFLARSNVTRCSDFKETADVVRVPSLLCA